MRDATILANANSVDGGLGALAAFAACIPLDEGCR
jgi:hypothetical protein